MSGKAVWRRLGQIDQLHELCLSLMKAGKAHREKVQQDLKDEQSKQKQDRKTTI